MLSLKTYAHIGRGFTVTGLCIFAQLLPGASAVWAGTGGVCNGNSHCSGPSTNYPVQVMHSSVYAALGMAPTDLSGALAYPNPWKAGTGGAYDAAGVTFTNLTQEATIRIFTLTGNLVRRLDKVAADGNQKVWDGKNTVGARVASGIYYYVITSPKCEKATGRLAVVR